jgi:hypothetical protein
MRDDEAEDQMEISTIFNVGKGKYLPASPQGLYNGMLGI